MIHYTNGGIGVAQSVEKFRRIALRAGRRNLGIGRLSVGLALCLVEFVAVVGGPALADTPRAVPASPSSTAPAAPAAPRQLSGNYFIMAALRASEAVANGQAGAVYDAASPVMKAAVNRDAFMQQVDSAAARDGKPVARFWRDVHRDVVTGPSRPGAVQPGEYVSVTVVAVSATKTVRIETVSFHNDGDNTWRLCGFAMRPATAG